MPSEAEIIRRWATRSTTLLREHIAELNALNVFPVADSDTGTNLYLTFESARTFESLRTGASDDAFDALSAFAKGAVEGARGNSGIIIAAALTGAVEVLKDSTFSLPDLLRNAAKKARMSVHEPQPGTILTLLDAIADLTSDNPVEIAKHARRILLETKDLLPQLKKAGVVDAGGRGLVIVLDALAQVCQGIEVESPAVGFVPTETPVSDCVADREYEVILKTKSTDMKGIQDRLHQFGTSITTTGDSEMMRVHIHTDDPMSVIRSIEEISRVWDINIETLQASTSQIGCVAYAEGLGNVMQLVSLGVSVIRDSEGDITLSDITEALLKSNHQEVILLVDAELATSAQQAIEAAKTFNVKASLLETPSLPATYAAITVFDSTSPFEINLKRMAGAIGDVETIVLRDEDFSSLSVEKLKDAELITVIWGASANAKWQNTVLHHLERYAVKAEVTQITGDQRSSRALVGVE